MCGIAGILKPCVNPDELRRACDLQKHRGPDHQGEWISPDGAVGLGHRRLSIIDLSEGAHQPMHRGPFHIVFNGEIYNFKELRAELDGPFQTQSDTEVILAGYEAWGDRVVERLRGMFALALWDDARKRLLLARDRLGIKPLFYAHQGETFAFASELKGVLGVERKVDPTAIYDYLTYLYVPAPKTVFTAIRKLPPAHRLIYENGRTKVEAYWDVDFGRPERMNEVDAAAALRGILKDAVQSHLVSDVPLGILLSGGLDSSCIAELAGAGVRTFSIGFDVEEHSETAYAKQVADHAGTVHTELKVGMAEAQSLLPRMIDWYDEPYYDTSALPSYLVCRAARRHVTVALSGDGGDEVFAGYSHYSKFAKLKKWDVIPAAVRRGVGRPIAKVLPARSRRSVDRWMMEPIARYAFLQGGIVGPEKHSILPPELRRAFDDYDELWHFRKFWRPDWDTYSRMQYLDMKTYLADDILTKMDRVSMAVSLEVRVPLLDHKVVEFVARVPSKIRVKGGKLKHLLRRAMSGIVPEAILTRKKKGFSIPQSRWLADGLVQDGREGMRPPARMCLWLLEQWSKRVLGAPSWMEGLRA